MFFYDDFTVTDETYIDPNSQPEKLLTDLTIKSVQEAIDKGLTTGIHRTKGRGNRLLILHLVGPDGLIPECLRVWIRSSKTPQSDDYHQVRNLFRQRKLLKGYDNILKNYVILMIKSKIYLLMRICKTLYLF